MLHLKSINVLIATLQCSKQGIKLELPYLSEFPLQKLQFHVQDIYIFSSLIKYFPFTEFPNIRCITDEYMIMLMPTLTQRQRHRQLL